MYGYACSPIAFRELVIVPVGGRGKAVMAFHQADGKVAWSQGNLGNVDSSPILINVSGLEQLAVLLDGAVMAFNPHNGDPQWQVPFKADSSIAVSTPVWGPGNLLFVSSEYNAGTKVIELKRNGLQTTATELWSSNRLRLRHDSLAAAVDRESHVRVGRSEAHHARSGRQSHDRAPDAQGFKISAKAPLLTRLSWTPPVLVHSRPEDDDVCGSRLIPNP